MEQVGPVNQPQLPQATFTYYRIRPDGELHIYHRGKDRDTGIPLTLWKPKSKGGLTLCTLYADGEIVGTGEARCRRDEAFSYRLGRTISKGRALKMMAEGV